MINLKPAIEAGYTGRGVEVGIVDTGESVGSISFPELYGRKEHGYNENYKNKLQKLYGVYAEGSA
ncbi:autotransporter [Neisseria gonorrhoeae]|nr:autotransporter [Neisseria gonorrhoeae]QWL13123.1 autotransporter [Neisseria gonorrhoeae]QXN41602.1 autotransporter [Neisseria gonorrhoeae]